MLHDTIETTHMRPDSFFIPRIGTIQLGELALGEPMFFNLRLSEAHRDSIETQAAACIAAFQPEAETKVARDHNLPTLLARVDCTLDEDRARIFECEERPAGLGITNAVMRRTHLSPGILPAVQAHFTEHAGDTPVIARHANAKPNKDSLVFGEDVMDLRAAIKTGRPLIVRGEPGELADFEALDELRAQSISTITTEGDKTYSLRVPSCETELVTADTKVVSDTSFVLKPLQGSKARGLAVYLSPEDRQQHGKDGTTTFARAAKLVDTHRATGNLLLESFKPPVTCKLDEGKIGNLILRMFCLVSPDGSTEVVGGTYVIRRELIVHGASNAMVGPVLVH